MSKKGSPTLAQLKTEYERVRSRNKSVTILKSTVFLLITVAALSVLVAMLFLPVFRIYGKSMLPTLSEGEIVVAAKVPKYSSGDIIGFYYGNKLLVKRYIAGPSDWVDIDDDGNVYVNSQLLDEPYVTSKSKGECDIEFPYQVPDGKYFVLGDSRDISVDSRSRVIGCISEEQMAGKIVFIIWPFDKFGKIR